MSKMSSYEVIKTNQITPSTSSTPAPNSSSSIVKHLLVQPMLNLVRIFFPSNVFVTFFISSIIPPIASIIIPIFFTGNIPDESGLAVSSQFMFISIILVVIQEGVGNSLFHFIGTHYKLNLQLSLTALTFSLVVLFVSGILLTIIILLYTPLFVILIDTPETISVATEHFLHTSAFSFVPTLFSTAFANYLLISTSNWLVVEQIVTVLITFFVNFSMFGRQSISLHWGIEELGIYKVIQSILNMLVSFAFVLIVGRMGPVTFFVKIPFFKDLNRNFQTFFKISWANFASSIVRNFFYFVVILKFINNLGKDEAAAWNLLNGIIWGVILIPGFAVANYVKVRIGHNSSKSMIKKVTKESTICLMGWIIVMVVLSGTLWTLLTSFFSKTNEKVARLSETMLHDAGWIFIVYSFNNVINSFFLVIGKTEYIFYQSFATNLIVYLVPWLLYLLGVFTPTYWVVLRFFIAGILLNFCLACYFSLLVWKSIPVDLEYSFIQLEVRSERQ